MIPTNKKIAVLHPYVIKRGGAVNMMIYLSNFLQTKNNNINFYTLSYDKKQFSKLNFKITSFNNSKIISFIKIAYHIKDNDYIFIGNSPMQFVAVISKILFRSKAKLIWWHHHYPWYYSLNTNVIIKFKKYIEKIIIDKIDYIIVNSKYLQDSIKEIYKKKSKILYPVLDDKFLNYKHDTKHHSITNTIFTYGRWVDGKNLVMVFETYEKLKKDVPNLNLIIGGELDHSQQLYIKKYNCEENVKFLGNIDKNQIIKTLEKSSLLLFPSKIDSFGLVILESMSIGVPVISYNKSGAKEIIKNGINGFLVDSNFEFIEKTNEVLNNSNLRYNLSIGSLNTINNFNNQIFAKQFSNIFK